MMLWGLPFSLSSLPPNNYGLKQDPNPTSPEIPSRLDAVDIKFRNVPVIPRAGKLGLLKFCLFLSIKLTGAPLLAFIFFKVATSEMSWICATAAVLFLRKGFDCEESFFCRFWISGLGETCNYFRIGLDKFGFRSKGGGFEEVRAVVVVFMALAGIYLFAVKTFLGTFSFTWVTIGCGWITETFW